MSKKRKHRRRKPLPPEVLEQRRILRGERVKRRKKEKRIFWLKIAAIILSIILLFAIGIVTAVLYGDHAALIYCSVVVFIAATVTDRSVRSIIFSLYPDKFIFSEYLKKSYPQRSFLMELARTVCYYSLCLIVLCEKLSAIWTVMCIASMAVGYVYIIFDRDDKYTFDKNSKYSDTSMFLIFTALFGMAAANADSTIVPLSAVVCGAAIITTMYILFGKNDKKIELTFETALFSSLDIMAAIAMIKIYL